jgi:hypothetical protein
MPERTKPTPRIAVVRGALASAVLAAALGAATAAALPATAAAQAGPPSNVRLDVHLDTSPWYSNGGLGFRFDIPIVREGLIDGGSVRDDLSLSLGGEFIWFWDRRYSGLGLIPLAMFQWNFYLGRSFSLFPELGLAFLWGPRGWNNDYWGTYIAPAVQVGFRWHFSASNALLVRIGWPAGLQVGITFDL